MSVPAAPTVRTQQSYPPPPPLPHLASRAQTPRGRQRCFVFRGHCVCLFAGAGILRGWPSRTEVLGDELEQLLGELGLHRLVHEDVVRRNARLPHDTQHTTAHLACNSVDGPTCHQLYLDARRIVGRRARKIRITCVRPAVCTVRVCEYSPPALSLSGNVSERKWAEAGMGCLPRVQPFASGHALGRQRDVSGPAEAEAIRGQPRCCSALKCGAEALRDVRCPPGACRAVTACGEHCTARRRGCALRAARCLP